MAVRDLLMPRRREAAVSRSDATAGAGRSLAAAAPPVPASLPLRPGEAWADHVLADLPDLGERWAALVDHASRATSARPTATWEKRMRARVAAVGEETARETIAGWLALVGRPVDAPIRPAHADTLRGLVWTLGLLPADAHAVRVLAAVVETCLRTLPGVGPRSSKIANAAVHALSRVEGDAALGQLARLAARVTFNGTLKEINAALDIRARALGLCRDEVEELAIPAYGLTDVGSCVERFGAATAEIRVADGAVTTTWRTAAGRTVKTPPASVRTGHAEALAEFKASVRDIERMLTAQTERIDRQFLARRVWPGDMWRSRYLDHPLVGTIARRLLWTVDGVPVGFADGALRGLDDAPVEVRADARVELWHPIGRPVDDVLAWRAWLERHLIVQPMKQAHREVYLLTVAEEKTGFYSNRYAAHVLRQHQFHALAAIRGWRNKLRMMVDDTFPPAVRDLPAWGLRAEFWVEGIGHDYLADTNESGTYLRIGTDQVRFYPLGTVDNRAQAGSGRYEQWVPPGETYAAPLPLTQVPALVLSEVFRDIDLFVGVASIGNDPTWQDGGSSGRFREYWSSYSFGELTATAQTRRDLLGRLVPRLAIADRAHIDGRFLVVRGDIRTYKIHLGSGNILMAPNDQYLCIVPKQTVEKIGTHGAFLPFEGDRMLAVILSKALVLAADAKITDGTITRQIGAKR
jgi:hypothetical protein